MARPRLFISYRRADAADIVRAIRERLAREYGDDAVFLDVDTLEAGEVFRAAVLDALGASDVVLVVMGPDWAGTDAAGRRRIDDPDDLVRTEVETALRERKHVVPLLVRGAPILPPDALPAPLRTLFDRNAIRIDADGFGSGMERVLRAIDPGRVRRRWTVRAAGAGALIAVAVTAVALAVPPAAPYTLTARVHGPGGAADPVGAGRLLLDVEGTRYPAELTSSGEAVFARLPTHVAGDSAVLTPVVDGFDAAARTILLPANGVIDVALTPLSIETTVRGLLIDAADGPVADAVVSIDWGSASVVDTTDALGEFVVRLPVPPGTRVTVRALRDGVLGHFDTQTVPAASRLTVRFVPGAGP